MPLNKTTLKADIKALIESLFTNSATMTPDQARESFADGLANYLDAFVKSGTVSVNVTTTGSATAQAGTGTGTIA